MEITEMYDMLLELQDRAEIEEREELSALRSLVCIEKIPPKLGGG